MQHHDMWNVYLWSGDAQPFDYIYSCVFYQGNEHNSLALTLLIFFFDCPFAAYPMLLSSSVDDWWIYILLWKRYDFVQSKWQQPHTLRYNSKKETKKGKSWWLHRIPYTVSLHPTFGVHSSHTYVSKEFQIKPWQCHFLSTQYLLVQCVRGVRSIHTFCTSYHNLNTRHTLEPPNSGRNIDRPSHTVFVCVYGIGWVHRMCTSYSRERVSCTTTPLGIKIECNLSKGDFV